MSRRARYAAAGALLSAGAPLGLLLVRALLAGQASVAWASADLGADASTYLYVALSTAVAFALFGFALGRQADHLWELSSTDELTGLRNRRSLEERLEEEFARSVRYRQPLSLLLVDLDGLKQVNDWHGHRAGDAALRRAASAIARGSRAADVGARWGGDEFVLLAPSTGREEALRLAERVRQITSSNGPEAGNHVVTVSIGVATLDPANPVGDPDALVRAADAALYEAKRAGRNRVAAAV